MKKYDTYAVGYYGMKNTGDDALLAATLWGAKEFLNDKSFQVSSPIALNSGTQLFTPTLPKKQRFRGQTRLAHYRTAAASKRIIFGGGSVLHTAQDINIKRHLMRFSGGDSHFAVGVGIGPFKNTVAEKACKAFLKECHHVRVRDPQSLDIASSLAPDANVKLSFDLAPLLLCNKDHTIQTLERKGIAISLCPYESLQGDNISEEKRLLALASAINTVYQQTGEPISCLAFNGHQQWGDEKLHRKLVSLLDKSVPVELIAYDENPFRVMQRMAGFKAIVSMRLHGSILGFLSKTPVISLNYHPKCWQWATQIGMDTASSLDAGNLCSKAMTHALLDTLSHVIQAPTYTVEQAITASLSNWS